MEHNDHRNECAEGSHESDAENFDTLKHPISIYIENAHDSNIGGFTIPIPTTQEEIQHFLDDAEISDWRDIAIFEATSDISGLGGRVYSIISDYGMLPDVLDELNFLAARIETIAARGEYGGIEIFSANIESGRNCERISEMINLTFDENLNCFDVYPVFSAEDYGDLLVNHFKQDEHAEEFNRLKNSDEPADRAFATHIEKLEKYIDKKAFGRATEKEENGVFTEQGYLFGGDGLQQIYRNSNDLPDEYRLLTKAARAADRIMKIDDINITEAIVKLHAVGCRNMEYAEGSVKIFLDEHKMLAEDTYDDPLANHYVLLFNRSDVFIAPAMEVYRRGSEMSKFTLNMTASADTKVFAVRVNNAHAADSEKGGRDLRGDLVELSTKSFNSHITHYAATPDRVDAVHDSGAKQSYDLFEWGQMLQKQDGKSAGIYTYHYSEADLKSAAKHFGSFMGSHELMCHAESFDFHLPKLVASLGDLQNDMIPIANDAAREILARGDADVYRLTENGVVKLDAFEALRPMCFAEYKDLAIKREDAAGLGKWAERKAGEIVRKVEREERNKAKNKEHEEL